MCSLLCNAIHLIKFTLILFNLSQFYQTLLKLFQVHFVLSNWHQESSSNHHCWRICERWQLTTMEASTAHVPVFDGEVYDHWIVKVKVIFRYQDVLDDVKDNVSVLARNATEVQQIVHIDAKKKMGNQCFSFTSVLMVRFLRRSYTVKMRRKLGILLRGSTNCILEMES